MAKTNNSLKEQSNKSQGLKGKQLVIVESPAKARTINRYLGPEYIVMASVGHVRDLPSKNPKGVKDPVPGVDIQNDFAPTYQIIKGKGKTVKDLKKAAKEASGIWLATDLDREGEAIAWHLCEALGIDIKDSKRVVFNAITKSEIEKAFLKPRLIDIDKVNAQQARRILDRIVGYQVSPLLWKKVAGGLSAGRVQSVAVRLLVEREREIESFIPEEYWRLTGFFSRGAVDPKSLSEEWSKWINSAPEKRNGRKSSGRTLNEKNEWLAEHDSLSAELFEIDGVKAKLYNKEDALEIAILAGFELEDSIEKESTNNAGQVFKTIQLIGHVNNGPPWQIKSVQTKRTKNRPFAPYITSTLQQAAANQLGFAAQATMRTAQVLYEGIPIGEMGSVGLITYMRTDSTHLANDAIQMVRNFIGTQFGEKFLPDKPNYFTSSNKAAQEAHEAIRPTDVNLTPQKIKSFLNDQQYKLYKIIWERFVACQMTEAQWDNTTILISGKKAKKELVFKASGRVLVFDGYYRVTGVPNAADEPTLPLFDEGDRVNAFHLDPVQNFTTPPPRYTEASLVKKLEAEGIGRPSTYAQIIQVIQTRKYAEKSNNRFFATDLGKVVTDKLIEAFPEIMQIRYTRGMEQQLDDIEDKHADWVQMLKKFYGPFIKSLDGAYSEMNHAKAETQPAPHQCPECGSKTVYRFGKSGRFLSCSAYPECKYAAPIDRSGNPVSPEQTDIACPKCNEAMLLRNGRFGPFLSCPKYPVCDGIVNLDKKGFVSPPKVTPLLTDLKCPKCNEPLNLRRSGRGPWLSCSKFPKCRGRLGWAPLADETKSKWEALLAEHEEKHPQPILRDVNGDPLGDHYMPKVIKLNGINEDVEESDI